VRFYVTMALVYKLADMAGAETPFTPGSSHGDPASGNFGKIGVKDKKFDVTAGLAGAFVFAYRQITGNYTTRAGNEIQLGGPDHKYHEPDRWFVFGRWFRGKTTPALGMAYSGLVDKKDFMGKPADIWSELGGVAPLAFKDIYQAFRKDGWSHDDALAFFAIFGIGVNTYDDDGKGGRRKKKVKKQVKKKKVAR